MSSPDLFDLAVARALSYAQRLGLPLSEPAALRSGLELWYLRTRFVYRVPLDEVVAALGAYPGRPTAAWSGGPGGGWREHSMSPTSREVAAVVKSRTIALPTAEAFDLFTRRIGEWWPVASHSISGDDVAALRFEPRVGGRVVEIAKDGAEWSWGDVLAWNPPNRFVISWHPTREPQAASTLEVRFSATADGGTELHLEHRGWEEFGEEAETLRERYEPGWDLVLRGYELLSRSP